MATMFDPRTTIKYDGEARFFDCAEKNLLNEIIVYHHRTVKGLEFDFCLAVKNFGLMIVEVKGWHTNEVIRVDAPERIWTTLDSKPQISPLSQSRGYRFALINTLAENYGISPLVMSMVCYPFMSETGWRSAGLGVVSAAETTLFAEDLKDPVRFATKIRNAFLDNSSASYDKFSGKIFDIARQYFEGQNYHGLASPFPPHSVLRVFPGAVSITDIETILASYVRGSKQIAFVNSDEALNSLARNLSQKLDSMQIQSKGGHLALQTDARNKMSVSGQSFRLFNFEAYSVPSLSSRISANVIVENGQTDPKTDELLQYLACNTTFNLQQYQVEHAPVGKDIQIKAGAGTGKTYSMVSRISYLINQTSGSDVLAPADEIAMLTFTSDAATNMKTRLKAQFMDYFILTKDKKYLSLISSIERMHISTIHSFAHMVLEKTTLPIGIGANYTTVSGVYQRRKIFYQVFNRYLQRKNKEDSRFMFDLPISMYDFEKKLIQFSEMLYNKGYDIKTSSLEAFGASPSSMPYFMDVVENVIRETEIEYSNYLLEQNSVSLNEYMEYLIRCVEDDSFNTELYKFKYLFVDEFQDVDDTQIRAFRQMQSKLGFHLFIVGDLKQSIYRFRGATMDAFTKMGCNGSEWLTYSLTINYRSDKRLLNTYDDLFAQMGKDGLIPYIEGEDSLTGIKNSEPGVGDGLLTEIVEYTAEEEKNGDMLQKLFDMVSERKSILEERASHQKLSQAEKTIAILVRTNRQVAQILNQAKKHDVMVESDTNGNLYQLQSTVDLCKLTAALTNPYNPIYLFDLITSNNVHVAFSVESIASLNAAQKTEKMVECLNQFYQMTMGKNWAELIRDVQNRPIMMMLRKIYEATMPWKADSSDMQRQMYYRTNYELLFEELAKSNKRNYMTLESINEALHILISTGATANSRELIDSRNYVRIICTTVHKSKGLEYDSVFLPFTTDKINAIKRNAVDVTHVDGKVGYLFKFDSEPVHNANYITDNEINELRMEESRILYVAMTRAINRFVWFAKSNWTEESWESILEEMNQCQSES